jgi:DNA modification methylase
MKPVVEINNNKIYQGDCRTVLKNLDENSVNCVVTSPPYFGLRNYGVDGQIGLEDSVDKYVQELVNVFSDIKRVLKNDGTVWLNLGDTYVTSPCGNNHMNDGKKHQGIFKGRNLEGYQGSGKTDKTKLTSLPQKNLIGIPWRVALALQADGWILRNDIIWNKPSCMPQSVTDRCTMNHEYIFLLSQNQKYYYDNESIKVPMSENSDVRKKETKRGSMPSSRASLGSAQKLGGGSAGCKDGKANKRTVWTVSTKPFAGAHYGKWYNTPSRRTIEQKRNRN